MNRRALLGRTLALVAVPALPRVGDLVIYPPAEAEAIVKATGVGISGVYEQSASGYLSAAHTHPIPGHTHSSFGPTHTHYATRP